MGILRKYEYFVRIEISCIFFHVQTVYDHAQVCVSYFHISESFLKLIKSNFNRSYLILQIKIWFENNFFHQCCITLRRVKYLYFSFPTVMIYSIKMFKSYHSCTFICFFFLTKNSMRAMQRNNSLIVDRMTPLTYVYIHNDSNSVILSISQISIYK